MLKTLKITGIISAILAAILLICLVFFGLKPDERIEQFLDRAGIIDSFMQQSDNNRKNRDQTSPLVIQARAFAALINPPPKIEPKKPKPVKTRPTRSAPKPKTVSAKFKLIGTCFYPDKPHMSWALLDEVGKGLRWTKQSSKVGHLIIEQVRDGLIVVRDGEKTFEMQALRPDKTSLLRGSAPKKDASESKTSAPPARTRRSRRTAAAKIPQTNLDVLDQAEQQKQALKFMKTLMTDPESMGISSEEAQQLGELGEFLKQVEQELMQRPLPENENIKDMEPNDSNKIQPANRP